MMSKSPLQMEGTAHTVAFQGSLHFPWPLVWTIATLPLARLPGLLSFLHQACQLLRLQVCCKQ